MLLERVPVTNDAGEMSQSQDVMFAGLRALSIQQTSVFRKVHELFSGCPYR